MTRDKAIHSKKEAVLTLDLENRAFTVPTDPVSGNPAAQTERTTRRKNSSPHKPI